MRMSQRHVSGMSSFTFLAPPPQFHLVFCYCMNNHNENNLNMPIRLCVICNCQYLLVSIIVLQVPGNRKACLTNDSTFGTRGVIAKVRLTCQESDLWEHAFGIIENELFDVIFLKYKKQSFSNPCYILGSSIVGCVANNDVIIVTLDNRNLYIIEIATGKHTLPPLVLPAKASHLMLNKTFLLCITCSGLFSVWNIVNYKVVLSEKSLSPILSSTPGKFFFQLTFSPEL